MLFKQLFVLSLSALATAAPAPGDEKVNEKRQFQGLFASFTSFFGISQTFDYVVLGGGTGGLTIAKRLAEARYSVAVIEAGTLYQVAAPLIQSTPAGDTVLVGTEEVSPTVDWGFKTAPDPASNNKARSYARGKCLGGSSARNFMVYQRPTRGSLAQWADEVGDDSYGFDEFLPYYKKSVKFTPPSSLRAANASAEFNAGAFDANAGPLDVSYANYGQPFSSYMEGALNELEPPIPTVEDFNSGSLLGCQYCSSTINPADQKRESSQTAFLTAADLSGFSNLKVFTLSMAKKINFNSAKKAVSVTVESNFKSYTINVRKEVIVSAGVFQSPQLLMVSGIGPLDQLKKFGIKVVKELAGVGQNMQDHVFFGPAYRVNVETLTKLANSPAYILSQFAEYAAKKTGPLTNPVCDFLGWEKVPDSFREGLGSSSLAELAKLPSDWPELEYISGAGYIGDFSSLFLDQPKDGFQYATILATLVAPQSRGNVTINSADSSVLPTINNAYLQSPTDQKVAIAGYKRVREAFATNFMKKTVIGDEYFPGKNVQTDAQILEVIKDTVQTVWHASCTCKMGVESDSMAVVDSHARVYGVKGVRVVDASAFPFLPPGHPQSTVYALAEKIADYIKAGQ